MAIVKTQQNCYQVFLLLVISVISVIVCQQDSDARYYGRGGGGVNRQPNPGDPDYQTYMFNNRRYGQYPPQFGYDGKPIQQPGQPGYPGYPGYPGQDERFRYGQNPDGSQQPYSPFPGVLGGWRPDLQGKERRDSLQLERDIFVTTNYGQVQGFKTYLYDNPDPNSGYRPWLTNIDRIHGQVSTFLGIPYAMPPTLEGRFKPPRPHRGWQLIQAVDFGPACPQPVQYTGATKGVRDMDEDCLYLNVYSPNTAAGVAQKYPVMFYIHGGEFYKGASNLFPGHILAGFYEVVVVTINYRLGALGFLSTGDDNSPGNYGVLDQAMALRWVFDNIEFFNGDRRSITLFGPGAGGASAGLLMVAPQTRDIVTRVIAQSGSAVADWSLIVDKYRAQNTSRVYGQLLGCSIESSWKLVNCLRQGRSFYELGNAEFQPHVGTFPWGPVLGVNMTFPKDEWYEGWKERDWHFLRETPEQLIRRGEYNRGLQYMCGVTTQEAAFVIANNQSLSPRYTVDERFFDQKVRELVLRYNYTLNPIGVYEAIKYMYTFWPAPDNETRIREQYIDMLSDFLYRAPTDKMIKLLVERRVPVYMYVMNTTIESLRLPQWRKVPHDAEHYLLTGAPFMDVEFFPEYAHLDRTMWTNNDRNMSHFFMKAFSNFARFGNPTPQQILGLHFEVARNGELKYLNLNTTFNSSIMMNYRQTEMAFWSQYIPTVVGHLVPTYPPFTEYWWEPKEPLQIAFWSMSAACLLLIVLVVVCCMLWRNAKRLAHKRKIYIKESDRYYSGDIFMVHENGDPERDRGIENQQALTQRSRENIYEYRDTPTPAASKLSRPPSVSTGPLRSSSQASIKTSGSAISLKEGAFVTSSPHPTETGRKSGTPILTSKKHSKSKTHLIQGVPQTEV